MVVTARRNDEVIWTLAMQKGKIAASFLLAMTDWVSYPFTQFASMVLPCSVSTDSG